MVIFFNGGALLASLRSSKQQYLGLKARVFFLQTQPVSIDLYFFSSNPGCGSWQSLKVSKTRWVQTPAIFSRLYIYCCQKCFWLLYVYICLYLSYTCWTPLTVSGDVVTLVEQTSHDWILMFNFSQPQPQLPSCKLKVQSSPLRDQRTGFLTNYQFL